MKKLEKLEKRIYRARNFSFSYYFCSALNDKHYDHNDENDDSQTIH